MFDCALDRLPPLSAVDTRDDDNDGAPAAAANTSIVDSRTRRLSMHSAKHLLLRRAKIAAERAQQSTASDARAARLLWRAAGSAASAAASRELDVSARVAVAARALDYARVAEALTTPECARDADLDVALLDAAADAHDEQFTLLYSEHALDVGMLPLPPTLPATRDNGANAIVTPHRAQLAPHIPQSMSIGAATMMTTTSMSAATLPPPFEAPSTVTPTTTTPTTATITTPTTIDEAASSDMSSSQSRTALSTERVSLLDQIRSSATLRRAPVVPLPPPKGRQQDALVSALSGAISRRRTALRESGDASPTLRAQHAPAPTDVCTHCGARFETMTAALLHECEHKH
jgi:hypothetical protein